MIKILICYLSILLLNRRCCSSLCHTISCKSEEMEDIDWFYLYKLPKNLYSQSQLKFNDGSGLHYMYTTSNDKNNKWTMSAKLINDSNSFPGQTLNGLFTNASLLLVAFNDEPPSGTTDGVDGHTKGFLASDGQTAIWLIHSVPKFPTISKYSYPITGEHYGQNILCITIDAVYLNKIGRQLLFNEPNIYFSQIPSQMSNLYANIEKAVLKKWREFPPYSSEGNIISLGGTSFKSFAKGHKFQKELYSDWVAPLLGINLYVETWRNGAGGLASNCTNKQKVYNVSNITSSQFQFTFNSRSDHSKWAVTADSFKNWFCAGDINRVSHQLLRGGGTVCQDNPSLANLYRNLVGDYENCPNSNK